MECKCTRAGEVSAQSPATESSTGGVGKGEWAKGERGKVGDCLTSLKVRWKHGDQEVERNQRNTLEDGERSGEATNVGSGGHQMKLNICQATRRYSQGTAGPQNRANRVG